MQINNSAFQKKSFFNGKASKLLLNFLSITTDYDNKLLYGETFLEQLFKWGRQLLNVIPIPHNQLKHLYRAGRSAKCSYWRL
jgi:hypothetical protein